MYSEIYDLGAKNDGFTQEDPDPKKPEPKQYSKTYGKDAPSTFSVSELLAALTREEPQVLAPEPTSLPVPDDFMVDAMPDDFVDEPVPDDFADDPHFSMYINPDADILWHDDAPASQNAGLSVAQSDFATYVINQGILVSLLFHVLLQLSCSSFWIQPAFNEHNGN